MELKTERLCLKPLGMQYLESVHEYASDIENTKYMMHLPNETIQEITDFLQNTENEWKKAGPGFYEFAKDERNLTHFIAHCDSENCGV